MRRSWPWSAPRTRDPREHPHPRRERPRATAASSMKLDLPPHDPPTARGVHPPRAAHAVVSAAHNPLKLWSARPFPGTPRCSPSPADPPDSAPARPGASSCASAAWRSAGCHCRDSWQLLLRRQSPRQVLPPHLHGRRAEPPRTLGPEARRPGRGPRRVQAHPHQRPGRHRRRAPAAHLAADAPPRPGALGPPRHQRPQRRQLLHAHRPLARSTARS